MSSDEAISTFLFFCVFIVLGGGALGLGVRSLLRRSNWGIEWFFFIWGGGFAGIPLLISAPVFLSSERPALFVALLFVFASAIGLVALMPSELFDKNADSTLPTAIAGAVLVMFGAALVLLTWRDGLSVGSIIGVLLALLGVVILFRSVLKVFHVA